MPSLKKSYRSLESGFEKLTSVVIKILGNSFTFMIALCLVIFWFVNKQFYMQDIRSCIGDIFLGVTFLSLFIIQRSFSRFSVSMHLKINELVASHEPASNHVINLEKKTEHEIGKLLKEHSEQVDQVID